MDWVGILQIISKAFIAEVIQNAAEIAGVAANRATADLIEAIVKELKKTRGFILPSFGTVAVKNGKPPFDEPVGI